MVSSSGTCQDTIKTIHYHNPILSSYLSSIWLPQYSLLSIQSGSSSKVGNISAVSISAGYFLILEQLSWERLDCVVLGEREQSRLLESGKGMEGDIVSRQQRVNTTKVHTNPNTNNLFGNILAILRKNYQSTGLAEIFNDIKETINQLVSNFECYITQNYFSLVKLCKVRTL